MNASNPPDISKIRQILEDPEAFNLSIDYQQMREVLNELFQQTDSNNKFIQTWQSMQTQFLKPQELKPLQDSIEKTQQMLSQQANDFGTEIREVRAFFTYQIKDLRSKVDENMATVVSELSKPVTPAATTPVVVETGQVPISDQSLRSDFEILKERFENLLETLQNPPQIEEEDYEEDENEKAEEEKKKEEPPKQEEARPSSVRLDSERPPPISIEQKASVEVVQPETISKPPSTPLTPSSQADSGTPKPKKDHSSVNRAYEFAINDLKVQVKKLLEKTGNLEEQNSQTKPTVNQLKESVDIMTPELAKLKTDVVLLKDDFSRLSEGNSESLQNMMREMNKAAQVQISAPKEGVSNEELQKQIKEMKIQHAQQIAKIETTLADELKKLKAELQSIKQNNSNFEKNFEDFKNTIPKEPTIIYKEKTPPPTPKVESPTPETPKTPKSENKVIKDSPKTPESLDIETIPLKEFAEKITQTIYDLPQIIYVHNDSQTPQIPNQMITTIIEDRAPVVVHPKVEEKVEIKPKEIPKLELTVKPPPKLVKEEPKPIPEPKIVEKAYVKLDIVENLSFSYENIEKSEEIENLENQTKKNEELIKDLYDQIDHITHATKEIINTDKYDDTPIFNMIDSHQSQINKSKNEIDQLKIKLMEISNQANKQEQNMTDLHSTTDTLQSEVDLLKGDIQNNSKNFLNLQKVTQNQINDFINQVTQMKKPILAPVKFSSLYVAPLPLSTIKQQTAPQKVVSSKSKSKKQKQQKNVEKETPQVVEKAREPPVAIPELKIQEKTKEIKPVEEEEESGEEFQYEKFPSSAGNIPSAKQSAKSSVKSIKKSLLEDDKVEPSSTKLSRRSSRKSAQNSAKSVRDSTKSVRDSTKSVRDSTKSIQDSPKSLLSSAKNIEGKSSSHRLSSHRSSHRSSERISASGSSHRSQETFRSKNGEEEERPNTPITPEIRPKSSHSTLHTAETSKSIIFDSENASAEYNDYYEEEDIYDQPINEEEEIEEEDGEKSDKQISRQIENMQSDIVHQRDQIRTLRNAIVEVRNHITDIARQVHDNDERYTLPSFDQALNQSTEKLALQNEDNMRSVKKRIEQNNKQFSQELLSIKQEIFDMKKTVNDLSESQKTIIAKVLAGGGRISKNQSLFIHSLQPNKEQTSPQTNEQMPANPAVKAEKQPVEYQEPPSLLKITSLKLPSLNQEKTEKQPIISPAESGRSSSTAPANSPRQSSLQNPPKSPKQLQQQNVNQQKEVQSQRSESLLPQMTFNETNTSNTLINYDKKVSFTSVVPQTVQDMTVLNVPSNIDKEVLQLIMDVRTQMQLQVDQNTTRLNDLEMRADNFVDKEYVSKFYTKMRIVITETHDQVEQIKQTQPDRVTKEELRKAMEELYGILAKDESTSGGTQSYRCLLCGRPKSGISGMITDKAVAESLGDPTQSVIAGGGGQKTSIIYGPNGQMYKGRGNFGRTTIAKVDDKKKPSM